MNLGSMAAIAGLNPAIVLGAATGSDLGTSALNNYYSKKNTKKAYERDLAFQQYQNDYNNPANQMQRLLDAGMNPNLLYQQISSGNSSGSVHSGVSQENYNNPIDKLMNVMSGLLSMEHSYKQNNLLSQQVAEASNRAQISDYLKARYEHDNKLIEQFPNLSTNFILNNSGQNARNQVVGDIERYSAPVYDYFSKGYNTSPHKKKERSNWLYEHGVDPSNPKVQWFINGF